MPKSPLPPNDELLRLLRAAYSRYSDALWHASPTEQLQIAGDRSVFVEQVAGHLDHQTRELLAVALNRECTFFLTTEKALTWAKQSLAAKRRWRNALL
jgi:hypothetical protein